MRSGPPEASLKRNLPGRRPEHVVDAERRRLHQQAETFAYERDLLVSTLDATQPAPNLVARGQQFGGERVGPHLASVDRRASPRRLGRTNAFARSAIEARVEFVRGVAPGKQGVLFGPAEQARLLRRGKLWHIIEMKVPQLMRHGKPSRLVAVRARVKDNGQVALAEEKTQQLLVRPGWQVLGGHPKIVA
jgi:hypothetical protein